MRLRKDQTLQENKSDEIMDDENISQIDLARAFIESNEKDDAIDLIKKIIDTGTEEEKHEANFCTCKLNNENYFSIEYNGARYYGWQKQKNK